MGVSTTDIATTDIATTDVSVTVVHPNPVTQIHRRTPVDMIKRMRKSRGARDSKDIEKPTERKWMLALGGKQVEVKMLLTGQVTIHWNSTISSTTSSEKLRPGKTCMYRYPEVIFDDDPASRQEAPLPINQEQEEILRTMVLALGRNEWLGEKAATDHDKSLLHVFDSFGANTPLALLMSNSDAAVDLFVTMCKADPKTLLVPHAPGFFVGENALHVLLVNRREATLAVILPLACAKLRRSQLQSLFFQQAEGGFFKNAPMIYYGGTILGYAVAFSMKQTVALMFTLSQKYPTKLKGFFNVDDPRHACKNTGFLPLHVAVANGLLDSMRAEDGSTPNLASASHTATPVLGGFTCAFRNLCGDRLSPLLLCVSSSCLTSMQCTISSSTTKASNLISS